MTTPNPYDHLCWYDKRYSEYEDGYEMEPRAKNCPCSNCLRGKDALAMEILRLREAIQKTVDALNYPHLVNPLSVRRHLKEAISQ